MTRPEAIALIQKIERMDKAVRSTDEFQLKARWMELHNHLRRMLQEGTVKESM